MHTGRAMLARCDSNEHTRNAQKCEPALQRLLTVGDPDRESMSDYREGRWHCRLQAPSQAEPATRPRPQPTR